MNEPFLSVVMSTLNTEEKYLKEAIDSILNQTYKNFEFIIIIDGGNDDKFIAQNYNDKRIKIIKHKESLGLTKSLNEGLKLAKGKYIARMDSDDISLKDRFKIQIDYMEKNKDIDITSMYYKEFGDSARKVKEQFIKKDEVKCKLFFINIIAHPSVMFRKKSLYEKNLFYNEEYLYSQDFELWNRYENTNIEIIPKFGLKYRIHNKQISYGKKEKQNSFYYMVLKRNLSKLKISEEYLNSLLVLNGRKKSKNYKNVYFFIKMVLSKNDEIKKFNQTKLKQILITQYEIYCIKNLVMANRYFMRNIIFLFKRILKI